MTEHLSNHEAYRCVLLFSCSVTSDWLWPHGLQHARLPCPSPSSGACLNSCLWVNDASNHLILCHPLLLLSSIFPNIRVFSSELTLCIRWPKYRYIDDISLGRNIRVQFYQYNSKYHFGGLISSFEWLLIDATHVKWCVSTEFDLGFGELDILRF